MRDEVKTKAQLIDEMAQLRQRVAELEQVGSTRQSAGQALRESEERYRLIFESSPICLWEQDFSDVKSYLEDLRCSGVSDFRAYFGKHPEAVRECTSLVKLVDVNRTALDFYQAETKGELLRGLDQVFAEESYDAFMEELVSIAEGRSRFESESSARTLGGERKDIALRWSVCPGFEETLTRVVVSDTDTTERKKVEQQLERAKNEWETTFDAIRDWVCLVDPESRRVLRTNRAGTEIGGGSFDELIGQTCCKLLHGSEVPLPGCPVQNMLETHQRETIEVQVPETDRWFSITVDPVLDNHGDVASVVHIARDITQWKRGEEQLRYQANLLERVADAIISTDMDWVVQSWNAAAERMYGWKAEEVLGTPLGEIVNPEYPLDSRQALIQEFIVSGHYEGEVVHHRRDGTPFWLWGSVSMLKDEAGNPTGAVSINRDITVRKRAEEALRESEERFRYLSEAAFEAIVIHEGGVPITANDQFFEMFGFQPDELLGRQAIALTVAPEARQAMREQIAGGGEGPYESTGLTKGGTRFPIEVRARQMKYEGREVRVATAVDITERKRAEELLCTQRDLALALGAAAGLGERLPLCLDTAMKVSCMDCGGVYLVEEASGALDLAADKGLSAEFVQAVSHYEGHSANARLVMAGNPIYAPYQELAVPLGEAERREGLRAIAVIPVRHAGRVIACINVASHALQEVPASLRPGLEAAAAQMANAIARSRAEEEVRQRNEELLALNAVAATLSSSLNLREILDSALDKVLEILAVEAGGIYLVDETSRRLTLMAHHGVSEEFVSQVGELVVDAETIARVTEMSKAGKFILAADLLKDRTLLKAVTTAIAREKLHPYLQVIIRSKGAPAGLLVAASREAREFTAREEQLLSTIAHQIGLAVENVGLYEEQVNKVFQMDALRKTALDITSQLDLDTVLRSIAARAVQLLRGAGGGLYLYRPEADLLEWTVRVGEGFAPIGATLQRGEGLSGKVWETGQPLIVEDYSHWQGRSRRYEGYRFEALVGVPVHWQKKFLGVLNVLTDAPRTFGPNDAELLSLFASQAAIAIENARLFAEQEGRAREMTALYETSLDISGQLALTDVLRSIMNRGVELLHAAGGAVWLYQPGEEELELAVDYGHPETYVGGRMKVGEGVTGKVFATGQAMAVEDYRHWEGRSRKFDSDIIGGMLGAPLMWGEQAIGVLCVNETEKPRKFTEEEVRLLGLFASQAAVAIENARLYAEQERRAREMTALYETSLDISGRLALADVLRSIMNRGVELLHTTGAAVWLYRPAENELELAVDYGDPETYVGGRMKVGEGVSGKVFATGQAMAVEDYRQWEGRSRKFDSDIIGGMLGVPLMWADQAIGVLNVNEIEKPRKFTEEEIRLLSLFANQAAIAIENARLYEEQQRSAREMTALYETSLDISGRLALTDLLHSIMNRAVELLGASGAAVWLYRPKDEELEFVIEHGGLGIRVGERIKLGEGLAGKALQTGEAMAVHDYRRWDGRLPRLDSGVVGGMVGVPLTWGEQAIGVLEVYEAEKPRRFTEAEIRLLSLFANQAAVAIQNARLHEETRRREAQLAALHDVALEIASELDLTVLLETVAQRAVDLLGGPRGGLYLYRPERQELEMVVHLGREHDYLGTTLRLGEGACGRAAQTGQPLVVVDYANWEGRSVKFEDEGNFNVLAVPIKHGDSLLGALYINDPDLERRFDEADIRLATMFANQAAIAIENARLHQEQQQRAQELTALHETALDITRHLDLDALLAAVVARATGLLRAQSGELYRPDLDDLKSVNSLGLPPELHGRALKVGEGLAGKVFETGEPLAVEDYEAWAGRSVQYAGYGFSRALAAPLRYGRRSVGVLVVCRPADAPPFSESDTDLLTLFGNQAAIAIENAQLLNAVATHEENLRGLSSRLIDAQEQERKSIAQELHDEMGQALTAMSINLSAIDKKLGAELDPEIAERLVETDSLITRTLEQMRELALDLRPSMLDDLGLLPALRWYVKRYENRTGIQVGLEAVGLELRLPEHIETAIYRVVQEALTNVARHARANRVDVRLQRRDSIVQAFIEDDGSGFDLAEVADREAQGRGVGLVGMRERIAAVGGSLEIESHPGKGTRLAIELPLP